MNNKIQINWGTVLKYGIVLFLISVVCTLLLALTNEITAPVIAQKNEEKNIEAQQEVIPEATSFVSVDDLDEIKSEIEDSDIIETIDTAYDGDTIVGYTVKTTPNGYGGKIELLTGVDTEGTISGIVVLDQSETAGLGARSTEDSFQAQYRGLEIDEPITVSKSGEASGNQINAISGATITSNAVTKGVNVSAEAVLALEEQNK